MKSESSLCALLLASRYLPLPGALGCVILVALSTAMIMDSVVEWRAMWRRGDLRPVWPVHQVQRVDLLVGALARHRIDAHARGRYLRSMLHVVGPFVPIVIHVPADQVGEARAVIRAQLDLGPAPSPPAG